MDWYIFAAMAKNDDPNLLKKIIAHAKEYGFVFPSSEIYDGLSAAYDYGQYGVELKNNIRSYWWKSMVQMNENIVGLDASIFMHPTTWKASGHVDAFNDPLIDNKDSKKRYRADVLIEDHIAKIEAKINKEVAKAAKRFGDDFDEKQFKETNPRVLDNVKKIDDINARFKRDLEEEDFDDLKLLIEELGIADPVSGSKNWTEVRQFNLMFSTELGSLADGASKIYLRPETAQGIFVNYLNVQKTGRMKLPFGIAQTGKAFRNEIIARQFIFRMREFEQMEMQFFVKPGTEMEWYEHWKAKRLAWHKALGLGEDSYKKLQFFDNEEERSYVPYVVETSIGLDRMFLAVLTSAFQEETLEDGSSRTVLKIPPVLAPIKAAVLPLLNKDGLPEKAHKILDELKMSVNAQYDGKDAIGRRYRRQDAIGTPYCITVDHQTLEDNTVTIRERDSMEQRRVSVVEVVNEIEEAVSMKALLKLGK